MTEDRTRRWLAALAERDFTALESLLDPDVTLVNLMTLDGSQDPGPGYAGRDQVLGYFHTVNELMPRRELLNVRVTEAENTTFLQFDGDFTTADGRPYRNIYVFRLDWRDGRITAIEEYGNPITFINTFPELARAQP